MGKGALIGGVGGFVLSPVIGRTLRTTGKIGHFGGLPQEERLKLDLPKMYEKATPVQKKIIEEILGNETLQKNRLVSYDYDEILHPNKGQLKAMDKVSVLLGDEPTFFSKAEVEELLETRLKVLKQLKENPDLIDGDDNYHRMWEILVQNDKTAAKRILFLRDCDIKNVMTKTNALKQQMLEHPQIYVSGNVSDDAAKEMLSRFFFNNWELLKVASVFDNETLNSFMRKRLKHVYEYIDRIMDFNAEEIKVLKLLCNSKNADDKPFTPNQKVEFIDLVFGYKENNLDVSLINAAVKDGKVDLAKIHRTLLNKVFKNIGLTDTEIASVPAEKMTGWDLKYIHLLAKSIADSDDEVYHDLVRAAILDDFMRYMHDGTNIYGKTN